MLKCIKSVSRRRLHLQNPVSSSARIHSAKIVVIQAQPFFRFSIRQASKSVLSRITVINQQSLCQRWLETVQSGGDVDCIFSAYDRRVEGIVIELVSGNKF